jgi:hypothetical protein
VAASVAGLAIWLDRQVRVDPSLGDCRFREKIPVIQGEDRCARGGSAGVLTQLDQVVEKGNAALRDTFFNEWIGIALLIVGAAILAHALRAFAAKAIRVAAVAGFALFLAGLAIDAPLTAVHTVDAQFNAAVTDVTSGAMRHLGVDPNTGPRDVLVDKLIVPQWLAGWFGDPESASARAFGSRIRDAMSIDYDQKEQIDQANQSYQDHTNFGTWADKQKIYSTVYGPKHKDFTAIAGALHRYSPDAYAQFQGKQSGRTGKGWTAAIEVFSASLLWIAASILKFFGLLIIRLAVLFGPLWIPAAMVSENVMSKIVKLIGAALFWAVAASAAVAAQLVVLVELFSPDVDIASGWRIFLLVLVTALLWTVLRPFKRLTQMAGLNAHATLGGAYRRATGAGRLAGGMVAGAGTEAWLAARQRSRHRSDTAPLTEVPIQAVPQEGRHRAADDRPPAQARATPLGDRPSLAAAPVAVSVAGGPVPVELAYRPALRPAEPPSTAERPVSRPVRWVVDETGAPAHDAGVQAAPAATYLGSDGEVVYQIYRPESDTVETIRNRGGGEWS